MSKWETVKEARETLKQKKLNKKAQASPKNMIEVSDDEVEQIDEDISYDINIKITIKKNGKPVPVKKDLLNWAGNILISTKTI